MYLHIFARFHAKTGAESGVRQAIATVLGPTREEPGCLAIHSFRSVQDGQLFFIHSTWQDEEAFDRHAELPHTVAFLDEVATLIDHPLEIVRTERLE